MDPETVEGVEGVGDPATDQMIEAPGGEMAQLDSALLAIGLPETMISVPVVVMCALLASGLVDVAKSYAPRGEVDSLRWQAGWTLVAFLLATLLGVLISSLGRVTMAQGLYLGLAAGVASPLIWRAARAALRRRGL